LVKGNSRKWITSGWKAILFMGHLLMIKKTGRLVVARAPLYSYNSWQLVLIKILFFLWFWSWTFKSSSLAIDLSKMCSWRTSHASSCTRSSCTIKKNKDKQIKNARNWTLETFHSMIPWKSLSGDFVLYCYKNWLQLVFIYTCEI